MGHWVGISGGGNLTPAYTQQATIVVADDDSAMRAVIASLLTGAGYLVIEVGNGQEALDRIEVGGIDLLITDLVMPVKEGIETIRDVRKIRPQMPIVAM